MEVFGITGTNGKTTTSYMLDAILREGGVESALVGTVTHRIGKNTYEAVNTTPGRELFAKYFVELREQKIDTMITEASSHALVQGRLEGVPIKHAAFTNLTRDHMDYHKNMEEYYLSKKKLFDFNSIRSAIINIDDNYGARLFSELKSEQESGRRETELFTVSLEDRSADFFAEVASESFGGTEFRLNCMAEGTAGGGEAGRKVSSNRSNSYSADLHIAQPGRYNIYNAVTAIALAAQRLGIEKATEAAAKAFAEFKGAPGRFEVITGERGSGITAVCDYAHTPDALENLLLAVRELKKKDTATQNGKIITVFGCGGDRDRGKRPMMGRIAGDLSDYVVITSDNPRSENPQDIIAQVAEGTRETSAGYITDIDRKNAIRLAIVTAQPGDIVVVAGKGHEDYQICGGSKIHFDDREIIRELL